MPRVVHDASLRAGEQYIPKKYCSTHWTRHHVGSQLSQLLVLLVVFGSFPRFPDLVLIARGVSRRCNTCELFEASSNTSKIGSRRDNLSSY